MVFGLLESQIVGSLSHAQEVNDVPVSNWHDNNFEIVVEGGNGAVVLVVVELLALEEVPRGIVQLGSSDWLFVVEGP